MNKYKVVFSSGDSIVVRKQDVIAPSIASAIRYIEREYGVVGVTTTGGVYVKRLGGAA